MSENSNYNAQTMQSYSHLPNILELRLETQKLIEGFEFWLRGSRQIVKEEGTSITVENLQYGKKRANELGVQSLTGWLSMIINPQTVQGNFEVFEDYERYVFMIHNDINLEMLKNCDDWEVLDEDIELIVKQMMSLVVPFMSRLIKNKERDSYSQTIKHNESNTVSNNGGGFSLFK